jgi:epoxyqueuosine reductase
MDTGPLKEYLKKEGATLVGIGNVTEALSSEILHLNRGIAIALNRNLTKETLGKLSRLQGLAEKWLRSRGYRALVIPPDSDRQKHKLIAKLYKLFCHKTAATCSGLGWVGKNGLVINRQYGSKLSWATVLTNAPLEPDEPVRESECGDCDLCVTHCPSGAIRGDHWSLSEPRKIIVTYEKCAALKNDRHSLKDKPNCGFCVTVCPYSRKNGGTDKHCMPRTSDTD